VIVRPLTTAMGRGVDEIDPQRGNPDQALETQLRQESIKRLLKKVEGFYNLCKRWNIRKPDTEANLDDIKDLPKTESDNILVRWATLVET
jgi:hypothetical protein